jgi:hypothetical protein
MWERRFRGKYRTQKAGQGKTESRKMVSDTIFYLGAAFQRDISDPKGRSGKDQAISKSSGFSEINSAPGLPVDERRLEARCHLVGVLKRSIKR